MFFKNKIICIAGKNSIAVGGLYYVWKKYNNKCKIIALCDDSDNGVDLAQPSYKKFANKLGVEIVSLRDLYQIKSLCFISLEYFKLIDPKKFKSNQLFNIHFSLLPAYKGMYTSAHPILKNEKISGCTFHLIDKGIDTGKIIFQESFSISPKDICSTLYEKYLLNGLNLVHKRIDSLVINNYKAVRQDSSESTYFSKDSIDYPNPTIDLKVTSFQLANQLRAYSYRDYQLPIINKKVIFGHKILETKSIGKPGKILDMFDDKLTISTVDYDVDLYFDNFDLLLNAVLINSFNLVKKQISINPFTIDEKNKKGWTPLIISLYNGYNDIAEFLLSNGADPELTNGKGTTPLMYAKDRAQQTGNFSGLRLLLNQNILVNQKDIFAKDIFSYLDTKNTYYNKINELLCM